MLDAMQAAQPADSDTETADALVLGTGFAGICAAVELRRTGLGRVLLLEKASAIGGTWRDNTYPGCACDVPSHLYSLSFAPKADWSRMYASQPEIRGYLEDITTKHDLRPQIRFGAKVQRVVWDEARALWRVLVEDGRRFEARFVFSGLGPLHIPVYPDIPGRESFAGPQFHSAEWDHGVDLAGKRVAVIGTGASAIQFVPEVAKQAAQLTVFQRTPAWIMPRLDREFPDRHHRFMRSGLWRRLFRLRIFLAHELRVLGFLGNRRVAEFGEKMARAHLHAQIADPALREKLTPDYAMGCKRVLISNDFYPALAQPNVALETGGIAAIRPDAIVGADGTEHKVDAIVYGTGFRTTDGWQAVEVQGSDGRSLAAAFAAGMHAYWGANVPGFPNFFLLLGPNTGLGHNSVLLMIQAQMHHAVSLIRQMARQGWRAADVRADKERAWNEKLQARMRGTVWTAGGCRSWYLDANGRNTTIWPGSVAEFQLKSRFAALADYRRVA